MYSRVSVLHSSLSLLLLILLQGHVQSMIAEEWKSRSIYQVLTDRFAPTLAASESASCDTTTAQYCGGTWQGIIRRLDYIQGMGFNAIWISPITKQIENNTAYGEAYHGYWQQDIYSLNPHFGTASDLQALSAALHARGMALMVDVVVNHFGSPYEVDYSIYTPFNDGSYFHQEDFITDYNNQTMVEQGWLGDGNVPLPDVDTENVNIVSTFNQWISSLVQTYSIDGLRIDTVKHVRKDFWPAFVSSAGVFALGEVLSGDPNYLSAYQPYVGGLLDYGTYYPLLRSFTSGGSMYELTALIAPSYRALFTDTQLLGTFMENHDQPRFTYSTSSDPAVVQNAMAYTLLSDGIPILYYGQEQSFNGGADPANREALWLSGYKITDLYTYIAKLNIARNLAWGAGFGTNLTTGQYVDDNTTVSQKGPLLLVLSNQGSAAANKTVSFSSSFSSGTILVNVLTCKSILVGKSSTSVTIVSGAPQVYLPQGLAQQMCTNIAAPTTSSSVISKISSIFTSSTKAAAKSAAKSSQSTYNSGTTSIKSPGLAITKATSTVTPSKTTLSSSTAKMPATTSMASKSTSLSTAKSTSTNPTTKQMTTTSSTIKKPSSSSSLSSTKTTSTSSSAKKASSTTTTSAKASSSTSSKHATQTIPSTSTNVKPTTSTSRVSTSTSMTTARPTTSRSSSTSKLPSTSSSMATRAGFPPAIKTSTTTTAHSTTTSVATRAGFPAVTAAAKQQKRGLQDEQREPHSPVPGRPKTPQQQQNAFLQGRKQFSRHTATTPPASFSQHYRGENTLTTSPYAATGLSSKYSYSANHLPLPNSLGRQDRSSSESNLQELQYKKGHRSQSQSLHTLRKQSSSSSLVLPPTSRANSFGGGGGGGGVPPIPPLSKLDTRAALFAENAPYVHAELLSTSSLVPPPIPNSRRSSGGSVYSFKSDKAGGKRYRHASLERQNILAQEHVGAPYSPSLRGNEVMSLPGHSQSRTSLHSHHGSTHHRRIDQRPQLQEDIRNYRV